MKHLWVAAILIHFLLLFQGCESKVELKQGTELYKLASALSLKFSNLQPDSNKVLVRTRDFDLRWAELLTSMYAAEGVKLKQYQFFSPNKLKATIKDRAETSALRKHLFAMAQQADIQVNDAVLDSVYHKQFEDQGTEDDFLVKLQHMDVSVENVKIELKKNLMIEAYVNGALEELVAVSDEEIERVYDQGNAATFRHILFATHGKSDSAKVEIRKTAEDVLARIKKGKAIASLAREYSDDPGSKTKGGIYVDFDRNQLEEKFAEAVFTLPLNEVSDLVETSFGYHIIKVANRKKEERPFDEVKEELGARLRGMKKIKAYATFLKDNREQINLEYVGSD